MSDFETFRDHFLSLYQSAVTDIAIQLDKTSRSPVGPPRASLRRASVSNLPEIAAHIAAEDYASRIGQPKVAGDLCPRELTKTEFGRVCAELAMRYLKARLSNDAAALARLDQEFSAGTCDPAWATTIEEYIKYFGPNGSRAEIPYIRAATVGPKVIEVMPNARVALVGDWGTGAQPAIQLLKQISDNRPDILIHLGDIYYSGTPSECERNFLNPINRIFRADGRDASVFTLAGNHDMYCGGAGYYQLIKDLNKTPLTQPASFFCLRTTDEQWQFLAMDTGLHDYSPMQVSDVVTYLEPDELEWHCQRVEEFPGRTILLSHHQLFSAYSRIGPAKDGKRSALNPRLYEAFKALARSGKIAAWFWGHEHTLSIYHPFVGLQRGRCLGHGAVPTSIVDKIYEPLKDLEAVPSVFQETELGKVGGVYAHGWALLSLNNNSCSVDYFQDINGSKKLMFNERF